MTYDYNTSSSKRAAFVAEIGAHVDAGIAAERAAQAPRNYLGASQIGDECARRIQFEITGAPSDPFEPRLLRIFERGHAGERLMIKWLRLAGFTLSTEKPSGDQHGFSTAGGHFNGHSDGVLLDGPAITGLKYPALWENKVLGSKGYKSSLKSGVVKAHPHYAAQVSIYQAYLDLADNPALVTITNADTMEIDYELVEFDANRAQAASDRAVNILRATEANELLPRVSDKRDGFPCGWCRQAEHCWSGGGLGPTRPGDVPPPAHLIAEPARALVGPPAPNWLLTFAKGGK